VDNLRTSQTVKSSWFEFRRQGHLAFSILITSATKGGTQGPTTQLVVVPFTHRACAGARWHGKPRRQPPRHEAR